MYNEEDILFLNKTLDIAEEYSGKTLPNPAVASLVVKNKIIISTGIHRGPGSLHAERDALKKAGDRSKGSTLYVNLEPCAHYGLTPPCTDVIIKSGIKKVVFPLLDPNPSVNGRGKKILTDQGIEVVDSLLTERAYKINEPFFIANVLKRPLITLKIASSLDGFIADHRRQSKWITSLKSREYVHNLRVTHQAILVGTNTIIKDNPFLNLRYVGGKAPKRIILDRTGRISKKSNVFKDENYCVLTSNDKYYHNHIHMNLDDYSLFAILKVLVVDLKIYSLLVEGGSKMISSFVFKNSFDYLYHFLAPFLLGSGIKMINTSFSISEHPVLTREKTFFIENDIITKYKNGKSYIKLMGNQCLPD